VRAARPQASDDEVLKRVLLAHAMLFTLRGVPVVYYGDEQGFTGVGIDQDARHDMMTSRTPSYLADRRIGVGQNPRNFDLNHPIARAIVGLSALRRGRAALRSGRQVVRNYSETPGLFAVSRIDPQTGREIVIAFNTSLQPLATTMEVDTRSRGFTALHGKCEAEVAAPGSYRVTLAPLDYIVCAGAGR
jgi:glycosidase